jgi:hypothetical protein
VVRDAIEGVCSAAFGNAVRLESANLVVRSQVSGVIPDLVLPVVDSENIRVSEVLLVQNSVVLSVASEDLSDLSNSTNFTNFTNSEVRHPVMASEDLAVASNFTNSTNSAVPHSVESEVPVVSWEFYLPTVDSVVRRAVDLEVCRPAMDSVILVADSEDLAVDWVGLVRWTAMWWILSESLQRENSVLWSREGGLLRWKEGMLGCWDAGMERVLLKCLPSKIS